MCIYGDCDECRREQRYEVENAELLAALKGLRACITETRGPDARAAVEEADRAIAKAEGA